MAANAVITNHIGSRFYPDVVPDEVQNLTYARFSIISDISLNTFQGFSTGMIKFRIQIDCYSMDRPDCTLLASEFDDLFGSIIVGSLKSRRLDTRSAYDNTRKQFNKSMDFSITITGA